MTGWLLALPSTSKERPIEMQRIPERKPPGDRRVRARGSCIDWRARVERISNVLPDFEAMTAGQDSCGDQR